MCWMILQFVAYAYAVAALTLVAVFLSVAGYMTLFGDSVRLRKSTVLIQRPGMLAR